MHKVKEVKLKFIQDDATGEFGLVHANTYDDWNSENFNAFWNGLGIFHDVFEHSHEHENKYFQDDYAMNVGGEMAAMGAMWYYFNELGVHNRMSFNRSIYSDSDQMRLTTESEIQEAITYGYTRYGSELLSNVPYQKPVENSELEYQIDQFWNNVQSFKVETEDDDEKEGALMYKKSVTKRKIADLHRYGFRMAERLVPDSWENRNTLSNFFDWWETFCTNNSAEELMNTFEGLTVKLYKDKGLISWKAELISKYPNEVKNAKFDENYNPNSFDTYDYYIEDSIYY
jgi:hypothetical protein